MNILLLESFYTSSHKQWADSLIGNSVHSIKLLSLPGRHWKWRMHHAGKYFAFEIAALKASFDLILCSDLMNAAEFKGILATIGTSNSWFNQVPVITYFHENQITYPWSEDDQDVRLKRDNHYGWINYVSCLASDAVLFNSEFHRSIFIGALPEFLNQFPKVNQATHINLIKEKSSVLPLGLDLRPILNQKRKANKKPVILWNHRWEYDKNPELFFSSLFELMNDDIDFDLIIAGENYAKYPLIFDEAKVKLKDRIIHFGFAKNRQEYLNLLSQSDILPVTSNQDFFGISAVEGIAAGCIPLLPNRLAFIEHLHLPQDHKYYYNDPQEYKSKLKSFILNHPHSEYPLKNRVLKYDQKVVAPCYDKFFNKIIEKTI